MNVSPENSDSNSKKKTKLTTYAVYLSHNKNFILQNLTKLEKTKNIPTYVGSFASAITVPAESVLEEWAG